MYVLKVILSPEVQDFTIHNALYHLKGGGRLTGRILVLIGGIGEEIQKRKMLLERIKLCS